MMFPSLSVEDRDLRVMADALFAAAIDREATRNLDFDPVLWKELEEVGLVRLTAPEWDGGSNASWLQAAVVLGSAADNGIQVPIAEHDLLAGWLLRAIGDPDGSSALDTVGITHDGDSCVLPWGDVAETAVIVYQAGREWLYARLPLTSDVSQSPVSFGGVTWSFLTGLGALNWKPVGDAGLGALFFQRGAAVRSIQLAGAMEGILAMTAEYTRTRNQFGQPLVKFQAVQRLIADIAGDSALASAAVLRLLDALMTDSAAEADFAVAKSCVGRAAEVVVRAAHQAHGAIGTTHEHRLHRYSGALYAWSQDFGGAAIWERRLVERMAGPQRATNVWRLVTGV
jgi:acyl-CoA dehydrogenase